LSPNYATRFLRMAIDTRSFALDNIFMSSIAIGFSQADDPQEAAFQAASAIKNQLKNAPITMLLFFTTVHYAKKEVIEAIFTLLKPAKLIGSSSAGLILSSTIASRGISLIAFSSTTMNFGIGYAPFKNVQESRKFGFELSRDMLMDFKNVSSKQASIVLCDGLLPFDNQFVLGALENLGQNCTLAGALSCDDFKFKRSFQFFQNKILSRSAVGLLLGSSQVSVAISNKHGFKPLGKPRMITSADGPIIHSIDNKPAIGIYEAFFKEEVQNFKKGFLHSPGLLYPLGIYMDNQRQYLLRYPVDILSDGSIVCQANVPSNSEVHLMINNKSSCRQAAVAAAQEIKEALKGQPPQLIIVFESMIRHKILGRHLFLEIQAIKEILGQSVPIAGMYSFGELCHLGIENNRHDTNLQNASLMLLAIG
jgi:hypothetical protein